MSSVKQLREENTTLGLQIKSNDERIKKIQLSCTHSWESKGEYGYGLYECRTCMSRGMW